jgi:GntR family transcriptional regulator
MDNPCEDRTLPPPAEPTKSIIFNAATMEASGSSRALKESQLLSAHSFRRASRVPRVVQEDFAPAASTFHLNRHSFIPLYQQIKDFFLEKILCGELAEGDAIPSEMLIAKTCGVSRMTVRQAFYELRVEGHVTRQRGRGTFVSGNNR